MAAERRRATAAVLWPHETDRAIAGGKAAALAAVDGVLPVPAWFVVVPPAHASLDDAAREITPAVEGAVRRLLRGAGPSANAATWLFAVRSSARDEDGTQHSFAGQYESFLYVHADEVMARVADVWRAAANERVAAYRRERGIEVGGHEAGAHLPAVVVQRMLDPEAAGVAFSADPVSGRRGLAIVSATWGVGSALVSGEVDADAWEVARDGTIIRRTIVRKPVAYRRGDDGPVATPVDDARAAAPSLTDDQVRAVALLARATERHFGLPQDVEWCLADGALWLLQSRPITSLGGIPDPEGALALWDNSNITESYGGVTTPLTYSFAHYVYEEVYRQFCRIVGVSEARIAGNADALRSMLGLVRGRVYYNLASWYRTLALLPGYRLNRPFMEQMMGVTEALPPELEAQTTPPSSGERMRDALALARTVLGLVRAHWRLPRDIFAFRGRLDAALSRTELSTLRADELVAHYRHLERVLLTRWDAPLVNDFFAMVHFGVLKKLTTTWCGDAEGSLQNDLVAGEGAIVSAEPARRIERMASIASRDPELVRVLREGTPAEALSAARSHAVLGPEVASYLATFGDRCLEELKLETETLSDDPRVLLRAIGNVAQRDSGLGTRDSGVPKIDLRAEAEARAFAAIRNPIKRAVFRWVLRHARERVRDRENLRFERTRVFGRVRRIFVELGRRYAAVGALDDPRDIFYLTVDEALGWGSATTASADIRGLAAVRRAALPADARAGGPLRDAWAGAGGARLRRRFVTELLRRSRGSFDCACRRTLRSG
jgi:rifampicin phosphotransferase